MLFFYWLKGLLDCLFMLNRFFFLCRMFRLLLLLCIFFFLGDGFLQYFHRFSDCYRLFSVFYNLLSFLFIFTSPFLKLNYVCCWRLFFFLHFSLMLRLFLRFCFSFLFFKHIVFFLFGNSFLWPVLAMILSEWKQ